MVPCIDNRKTILLGNGYPGQENIAQGVRVIQV